MFVVGVGVAVLEHVGEVIEALLAVEEVGDDLGQHTVAGGAGDGDVELGVGAEEGLDAVAVAGLVLGAAEFVEAVELDGIDVAGGATGCHRFEEEAELEEVVGVFEGDGGMTYRWRVIVWTSCS